MPTVEEVSQRVQRMLADNFPTRLGRDGDFFVDKGSTSCRISCTDLGSSDHVIVKLQIPVLFSVPISDELCRWVAMDTADLFGSYGLMADDSGKEGMVYCGHNLLGNTIDTDELCMAVAWCLGMADMQDDELQKRFGGRLAREA